MSTVASSSPHFTRMQNRKLVKAIIWLVVISMVLALGISVFSIFS